MEEYKRTHTCGELNKSHLGKKVSLCGWVHRCRDFGNCVFIDLRDKYGLTQIVLDGEFAKRFDLHQEWVINVKGIVSLRGEANTKIASGEIEIKAESILVLSKAKTPPFVVNDEQDVKDDLRLKYRYLDFRKGYLIDQMTLRHRAVLAARNFFDAHGFTEVATPILSKSTPEGARDYLVPSRVYPAFFYALPQSPQLFKQLLMIGGLDKYFQIATCFRDEDLRSDRQPEFTQIDVEMSFNTPQDVFFVIEKMMKHIFKTCIDMDLNTPFMHMRYKDCLEYYGCDKPDLRYDMKFFRLDDIVKKSSFAIFKDDKNITKAFVVNNKELSRKELEEYSEFIKPFNVRDLYFMKRTKEGFSGGVTKFFTSELLLEIEKKMGILEHDTVLIVSGEEACVNQALDQLRRLLAKKLNLIKKGDFKFLWVEDFPLFSLDKETKEITSEHHPFTMPHLEDIVFLEKEPLRVRSLSYDLVLNGYELASGSQRIHNEELQAKIFHLLKLTKEEMEKKFGFFIEALQYGTPPHGGIAVGLDRLMMILSGTENIRDVVAFPKTIKAADLMTGSPSLVDEKQLRELKIKNV
jgi:aspartyl-tRNA synthetase